ncbi:arylesterase [Azohydromonas caseinilytica]|uniref:Arylesterase n=1 Tax=Azohydromonas caseinilytica TaxID=2728836 RepID=A0A848F6Z1_9BURK|nr:arylesterase [Azohydromonas caseinilytica]NML14475.1 arylesterase [Azohydromonas caseinilytica]
MQCSLLALAPWLARPAVAKAPAVVLVVGDSLSAEYGLKRGSGWVALLQQRLERERIDARVVNASISGDTTAGGRSRLPALLKQHQPTHVILELGANDALRGQPVAATEANLAEMTRAARAAGAKVVLAGMQLPPNYGRRYAEDFAQVYARVAKAHDAALVPFFLRNVADVADSAALFQADRIHPREEAQPLMLDNVWPVLRPLLK